MMVTAETETLVNARFPALNCFICLFLKVEKVRPVAMRSLKHHLFRFHPSQLFMDE